MNYFFLLLLAAIAAVVAVAGVTALVFGFISYCCFEDKPKTLMTGMFVFFVSIGMIVMHQGGVIQ